MEPHKGDKAVYQLPGTAPTESKAATITEVHVGSVDLSVEDIGEVKGVPYSGELYQAKRPDGTIVPYARPGTWRWDGGGPVDPARVDASKAVQAARARGAARRAKRQPRTTEPSTLPHSER